MRTELVIGWTVDFDDIEGLFRNPEKPEQNDDEIDEEQVEHHFYLATGETNEADEKKVWWCTCYEDQEYDSHTWYIYHHLSRDDDYDASDLIRYIETAKNDIPLLHSILERSKINTESFKVNTLRVMSVITDFYHS
jgi:mevalonate pyrophosphate decarboxylase